MKGLKKFTNFVPGSTIYNDSNLTIETHNLNHPGGCVSYKITEKYPGKKNKIVVFATDFEPDGGTQDRELIKWWKGAHIIIADGQYDLPESKEKKGWGHSNPFTNVDLAIKAGGVGEIIMTHHDPNSSDKYLNALEDRVVKYAKKEDPNLKVSFAREGKSFELTDGLSRQELQDAFKYLAA
ncbi:hypothetical protein CMI39_02320 [Candidatus Pacearchaeota archaeon]|jgi:phosphoribosyl 1,2-cyclic phosphodiesterase|nr:hypothetical protein [Candidatus Pacearchaeota archaeon]|tara:strand:- start:15050 stop:15592 length:543 start_codon:yes stop_codon:yes gene_type:complete